MVTPRGPLPHVFWDVLILALVWHLHPSLKAQAKKDGAPAPPAFLQKAQPAAFPKVTFTEVARQAGIDFQHFYGTRSTQLPEDTGSGAAWGDYDNDGHVDLYLCNIAGPLTLTARELQSSPAGNKLYRNNGDGTFTDVTARAGVGFKGFSMGAAWGDFDGDGNLDLLMTNFGANILYRNNGDGAFTDVSKASGVGEIGGFWTGASWADYDLDGDVDLYICGYVKYEFNQAKINTMHQVFGRLSPLSLMPATYPPERNLLYRNNGDGTFTEVAKEAGVDNPTGRSCVASWCDFNNDGRPDLFVANDMSADALFVNLGNGRFMDASQSAGMADKRGSMGLGVGDWDNDGDMDIFITHWFKQASALFDNLLYVPGAPARKNRVLRFADMAEVLGLAQISVNYVGWGTSFFDYDNDGRQDLFVANGSTFQDEKNPKVLAAMRNFLFWNKSNEDGFVEVGQASGAIFRQAQVGRGAAFADYDNDGDVDIVVVNHGGPVSLLRNDGGNQRNSITVRLRGSRKNRFGVGARIEITAGGKKQIREISSQPSYLSQNPFEAHFCLGATKQVDRLVVTFPAGKKVERRPVTGANQRIVVSENER